MQKNKNSDITLYLTEISRNVRRTRGTTSQAEFAKKVGISTATIHRIESCKNFQIVGLLQIAIASGLFPYELCLTPDQKQRLHLRTDVLVESFKEDIKNEILAELKKNGQ